MTNDQQHHEPSDELRSIESMLDRLASGDRDAAPPDLERVVMERSGPVIRGSGDASENMEVMERSLDRLAQCERASAGSGLESRVADAASLDRTATLPADAGEAPVSLESRIFESTRPLIASVRETQDLRLVGATDRTPVTHRTRWMTGLWTAAAVVLLAAGGGLLWYASTTPTPGVDVEETAIAMNDAATLDAGGVESAMLTSEMLSDVYTIIAATQKTDYNDGYDGDEVYAPARDDAETSWCLWCALVDEAEELTS